MSLFSIPQHKWQPTHLAQALANARKVLGKRGLKAAVRRLALLADQRRLSSSKA
jgi:hypothetical protein